MRYIKAKVFLVVVILTISFCNYANGHSAQGTDIATSTPPPKPLLGAPAVAPGPMPSFEIHGWGPVPSTHQPEVASGSRYLYTDQPGTYELNLNFKVPEHLTTVAGVTGMALSVEFYTAFETLDNDGLAMIDVAFHACWHSNEKEARPQEFVNAGNWTKLEFMAKKGEGFDYSLISCLTQVKLTVKVGDLEGNFVAIRNLTVTFQYDDGESKPESLGCDDPDKCGFEWGDQKMSWSRMDIPRPQGGYWTPNKNMDILRVTFSNLNERSDANITLNYLVTDGAVLLLSGTRTGKVVLSRTSDQDGHKVWVEHQFKLSDVLPKGQSAGNEAQILLTAHFDNYEDGLAVIGVQLKVDLYEREELLLDTAPLFLPSWHYQNSSHLWHVLPNVRLARENNSLEFRPTPNDGVAYIYSDWFKSEDTASMDLQYTITTSNDAMEIDIEALVLDETLKIAKSAPLIYKIGANSESVPIEIPSHQLLRLVLQFTYKKNSTGWVAINDVSLGDGCDPDPCVTGNCARNGAVKYTCECPQDKRGLLCELENFCGKDKVAMNNGTMVFGNELCSLGGAHNCISHSDDDAERPFDCDCGLKKYWFDVKDKCMDFVDCDRVSMCPLENTKCVDSVTFDENNPCAACADGFERLNSSDPMTPCVKADPCRDCGDALCEVVVSNDMFKTSIGHCYCPRWLTYDPARKECTKMYDKCPEIVRTANGCEQDCDWSLGDGRTSLVTCKCWPGWTRSETSTACELNTTSSCNSTICSGDQLCKDVDGVGTCVCPPGMYKDSVTGNCTVDFCTAAKTSETLKTEIVSICGYTFDNCTMSTDRQFLCDCGDGYSVNSTSGQCTLVDPCAEGEKGQVECAKANEICLRGIEKSSHGVGSINPKYSCGCPPGHVYDNGHCVTQCEEKENAISNILQNKACRVNYKGSKPNAVCQPGFLDKDIITEASLRPDGSVCQLAEYAYLTPSMDISLSSNAFLAIGGPLLQGAFQTKCSDNPDPAGCSAYVTRMSNDKTDSNVLSQIEMETVDQEVKKSVGIVFRGYHGYDEDGFSIVDYKKLGDNLYRLTLALVFGKQMDNDHWMGKLAMECNKTDGLDKGTCVLPAGVTVKKMTIASAEGHPLNPCVEYETGHIQYCSEGSQCELLNGPSSVKFSFRCTCSTSNFTIEQVVTMDPNNEKAVKEICVDIDECKLPSSDEQSCPEGSLCTNTVGSKLCSCPAGLTMVNSKCTSVCNDVTCQNGGRCETHPRSMSAWICRCADSWQGDNCEAEDPVAASLRTGLISTSVVLVLLLVAVIAFAWWKIRQAKGEPIGLRGSKNSYDVAMRAKKANNGNVQEDRF